MATVQDKMCSWAKKIADGGQYKYKRWNSKDEKTKQCPICKNLTGKYKGWNCIGFAFACWKHGGGLKTNCNCGVINNSQWEDLLKAKTDADATKIAQKCIGIKEVKVIRNGGKAIPVSKLQKGDILGLYDGKTIRHIVLYVGNSKIAESTSAKTPNIGYGRKLATSMDKVAIRYTGANQEEPKKDNKMEKCIDISAWQGKVSVADFQKTGINNVILRSSYTTQSAFKMYEDKVFDNNIKNAYKAHKKIGIYHYSQATTATEAKKEAEFVLKTIAQYKEYISLPVWFDWEFGGRLSAYIARKRGKDGCKLICSAFCNTIKKAGYKTGVYANLSTLNAYLPSDLYKTWDIWVAQYHSRCDYKHPYKMWQYTSSGKVAGLSGRIDMNYLYKDAPEPEPKRSYGGKFPTLPKRGWFSSGDKGEQVKLLQKFLNWYGDYGLAVDGELGPKTIEAVRKFQGREKLKVDGAFGKESLKRAKVVRR